MGELTTGHNLREAVRTVVRAVETKARPRDWRKCTEGTLWYELGACILSSRVRYEESLVAARSLRAAGLLSRPPNAQRLDTFERAAARLLAGHMRKETRSVRYRFPKLRAQQLRRTAEAIYGRGLSIRTLLVQCSDSRTARSCLIARAAGIGPKQASMFLRNIGFTHDLAVIDAHVLRYLVLIGEWPAPGVNGVDSLRKYEAIEERFRCLAAELGTVPAYLDTAIWVVMRALAVEDLV